MHEIESGLMAESIEFPDRCPMCSSLLTRHDQDDCGSVIVTDYHCKECGCEARVTHMITDVVFQRDGNVSEGK